MSTTDNNEDEQVPPVVIHSESPSKSGQEIINATDENNLKTFVTFFFNRYAVMSVCVTRSNNMVLGNTMTFHRVFCLN